MTTITKANYIGCAIMHFLKQQRCRAVGAEKESRFPDCLHEIYMQGTMRGIGVVEFCERSIEIDGLQVNAQPTIIQIKP
ncbi:hypothetical protein [Burkholderia gladioli]|uniref:hypothetical protein n=1 Tax=Burkholderia gladioli TaxID=28095 RepID=UPI0015E412DD|nr:hypothetical protein [Burkholderia gladioli]